METGQPECEGNTGKLMQCSKQSYIIQAVPRRFKPQSNLAPSSHLAHEMLFSGHFMGGVS